MPKAGIARKSPSKKTAPKPLMVVTRKNAFGWLLSLFVVCGCMFVIGILVGRGQAPVQFDTHEWEQDLKNLKISVLAKREEIRESIGHIEIFDYLKEKGKSVQFYKQYVPPVLSPKYGKYAPTPGAAAVAGETSSSEQLLQTLEMEQPAATPTPDRSFAAESSGAIPPAPDLSAEASHGQAGPAETSDTFGEQEAWRESIGEYSDQTTYATNDMIAVKAPATPRPSTEIAVVTPTIDADSANAASDSAADPGMPSLHALPAETAADMPVEKPQTDVSSPKTAAAGPGLQYAIQVASLREPEKAAVVRDKFRLRGYPAYCQSSEVQGVIWHRVRIGPYPDRQTADQDYMRLKEVGVDALVFVLEQ
jgi:cell division septation protein DedD